MIRSGILAVLALSLICGVTEARGRNRVVRYSGYSWQQPSTMTYGYNYGTPQYATPQYAAPQYTVPQTTAPQVATPQQATTQVATPQVVTPLAATPQHVIPQGQQTSDSPIQRVSFDSSSEVTYSHVDPMQAWAEEEVRMMAMRGTCGHIRPAPMGCFVGVGCGTTCMGSGTLVAEAHYQGRIVRVWRR